MNAFVGLRGQASTVPAPAPGVGATHERTDPDLPTVVAVDDTGDAGPGIVIVDHGRAGRDLTAATAVGVGLGLYVLLSVYLLPLAFVAFVAVAVLLALHEVALALRTARFRLPLPPLVLGGIFLPFAAWYWGWPGLLLAAAGTAAVTAATRVATGRRRWVRDSLAGGALIGYVPLLAGCTALLLRADQGPSRVVTFVLVTACSDVGAYAIGVLFGRHRMAPRISPKKSWEGFGGALALGLLGGLATVPLLFGGAWWQGVVLGLAAAATATAGDLAESLLKRRLKIKDMGTLLPGHGGVMDRADSLLPTALVTLVLLDLFLR